MKNNRLLEISDIVLEVSKRHIVEYDNWYDKDLENELIDLWNTCLNSEGISENNISEYFLRCAYNNSLCNAEYTTENIVDKTNNYKDNPNNNVALLDLISTLLIWCINN